MIAPSLLLAIQLTLQPQSALRLVNPRMTAVEMTVRCGARESAFVLGAGELKDLAPCGDDGGAVTVLSPEPVLALETFGETQRLVESSDCTKDMTVPLFACRRGTASAVVPEIAGATYNWSVEGATIVSGAGTNRVNLALGDASQARLSCLIASPECNTTAGGVISVRDPLVVSAIDAPATVDAKKPVTLTWTYPETQPTSQVLTGDALAAPVTLDPEARSYTFVPVSSGMKTMELLASYAIAIRPAPGSGKRRSAGRSVVSASACPDARATAKFEVRGCVVPGPNIVVQNSAYTGETIDATVTLGAGETALWTVTNGTLLTEANIAHVRVRGEQEGKLTLSVRIERDPSCFSEGAVSVNIRPRPGCTSGPTAKVDLASNACDSAVIRARFTGRPPFQGRWSDGQAFATASDTITREVRAYGVFTIDNFGDADGCQGVVTGSANFQRYVPKATLQHLGGNCSNSKIVVKFTGTPPFHGTLFRAFDTGSQSFNTNATEIELQPLGAGMHYVTFSDGLCANIVNSDQLPIVAAPVLELPENPSCYTPPGEQPGITADFHGGSSAPYIVEWADGTISQSQSNRVVRKVPAPTAPIEYYDIVRASAGACQAIIPVKRAGISLRTDVKIASADRLICPGVTGSAQVASPIPNLATFTWSIDGGEIVSGQGTPQVTYRQAPPGKVASLLKVTASWPDKSCTSADQVAVSLPPAPVVSVFAFEPTTIKTGGTSTLYLASNGVLTAVSVTASARNGDLGALKCSDTGSSCTAAWKDTNGPGTITATLTYRGDCSSTLTKTATLTVEP